MLGGLDVRIFTRDDVERLRDVLDAKIVKGALAWKTAASVWTLVTSMCSDMVNAKKRELRMREDNPCRDVKPPERGERKSKQYLYPSEFLKFVSCASVPLKLRRAAAISVYTFVRDGELRALRWDGGDVDMAHGTLGTHMGVTRGSRAPCRTSGLNLEAAEHEISPRRGRHGPSLVPRALWRPLGLAAPSNRSRALLGRSWFAESYQIGPMWLASVHQAASIETLGGYFPSDVTT
jgi:hypothetical protein